MSLVIDIVGQFSGKKAFDQAENAAEKLGRTVKTALIGVGVTAFAKSAISAFAAQEYVSGIPVVQQTPFFFGDPIF